MKIWDTIINEIKQASTIILQRHVLPDGDAIGSQLALKQLINLNWPQKKVYAIGTMVDYLKFLSGLDQISDATFKDALVIVTDTANTSRIDDQRYQLAKTIIKIDHHPNHDAYGNYQWVDTSYPAACEMIADFIFEKQLICDPLVAKYLLVGIITDTSRFMLRQISARTFKITAQLLTYYQENITKIYDELEIKSSNDVKLLQYCYENYQISPQGIINLKIKHEFLQSLAVSADMAAFHVNIFSNVMNHPLWLVAIEYPDSHIRCELRTSNPHYKVNTIAVLFGGGGHDSAAGCKIKTWSEFETLLLKFETLVD